MKASAQHHYVTSAYLEGFLAENEQLLYVYTRDRETSFRLKPEKVARIHNYYSHVREDGSIDDRLEATLQKAVEDPGLAVLRRLNRGRYDISSHARGRLALLMAIQEYRVPWMRGNMEEVIRTVQEQLAQAMLDAPGFLESRIAEILQEGSPEPAVTADEIRASFRSGDVRVGRHPNASLWAMGAIAERLTDMYFGMQWNVLESRTTPFITSDCPVHRFYAPTDPHVPYQGLVDPRAQVRFPISHNRMLLLEHDFRKIEIYNTLIRRGLRREAERRRAAASEIRRREIDEHEVEDVNSHTISMAARIVISPAQNDAIPPKFRGECKNIRYTVDRLPEGLLKMTTEYPTRK